MSTLYHNPRCSKSRAALDLLRARGVEPDIRDYLHQPPSVEEFRNLLGKLGTGPRGLLRTGEAEYAELGLDDPALDDATLLAALQAHPRLMERPVFIHGEKAVIGRPAGPLTSQPERDATPCGSPAADGRSPRWTCRASRWNELRPTRRLPARDRTPP